MRVLLSAIAAGALLAAAFTELYRRTFGALDADTDAAVDAGAEPDADVTE